MKEVTSFRLVFFRLSRPTCSLQVAFFTFCFFVFIFYTVQLVHNLLGHSLTVNPAFAQFIIPDRVVLFFFSLSLYLLCTKLFLAIFQVTRTLLNYDLPFSMLAAHSNLVSSANLGIVICLICLSVSLMKHLSCIKLRMASWRTRLRYYFGLAVSLQ